MRVFARACASTLACLINPVARGLRLSDYFIIVLAQIKAALTSVYMFGPSSADKLDALTLVERPFLAFCWLVASRLLPVGRRARRDTCCTDSALPSREADRTIPVTIAVPNEGARPLLILFMHGGGLVLGSAREEEVLYRFFASRLKATVVSVEYRMVPEAPFPACIDDCEDAALAVLSDPAYHGHRFIVAGMSAGGYLAIQLALLLAHAGVQVDAHVAIAPMVGPFGHFSSLADNAWLGLFPLRTITWMWGEFLRGVRPHEWTWRVSALLATDEELALTCPGIVTYHQFDTLRDEGEAYVRRLEGVGKLHGAREMPYPHGSGVGMYAILDTVAQMIETRLEVLASAECSRKKL